MAQELIEWAVESVGEQHTNPIILPAFHVPYHEELIRAKDDDETRRALLHAIRDVAADSTNLITEDWRKQNDPLLPYLRDLAIAYRRFIETAKNGWTALCLPQRRKRTTGHMGDTSEGL